MSIEDAILDGPCVNLALAIERGDEDKMVRALEAGASCVLTIRNGVRTRTDPVAYACMCGASDKIKDILRAHFQHLTTQDP